jgi:hypothetical protein
MTGRRPVRAAAVAALVAAALAAPGALAGPTRAPAGIPVQPGMEIRTVGVATCTGGFLLDGLGRLGGRVFMATAAHCVESAIGAAVTDSDGQRFGRVVFSLWPYRSFADDIGLIEIDRTAFRRVDPAMKGHPTIPTGLGLPGRQRPGDLVTLSGYGMLTEREQLTREQRPTALKDHGADFWSAWGVFSPGDSGGPVAHSSSGAAIGSVSNLCVPLPVATSDGFEAVAGCTG